MSLEGQDRDKESLRTVTGKISDFPELAKDCVAFANAQGGSLLIGIEDKEVLPPADRRSGLGAWLPNCQDCRYPRKPMPTI
jgi:ATP-dependent DNA helicase RecG